MCREIRAARRIACYGVGPRGAHDEGALHAAHAPRPRRAHGRRHDDAARRRGRPAPGERGAGMVLDRRRARGSGARGAGARTLVVTAQPDGAGAPPGPTWSSTCRPRRWPTIGRGAEPAPHGKPLRGRPARLLRPRLDHAPRADPARRRTRCASGTRTWNEGAMDVGLNLCFAIKRWPEPEEWARIAADELGVSSVQFTMDLIDPWWPESDRAAMAARVREAAGRRGIAIHSVQIGLAGYTYNGLLHPDETARRIAEEWWRRSIDLAAELGAGAVGRPDRRAERRRCGLARAPQGPLCRGRRPARRPRRSRPKRSGLDALLVEPTPLPREIPSTIDEAKRPDRRHLGRRRAAAVRDRRRPRPVPAALRGGRLARSVAHGASRPHRRACTFRTTTTGPTRTGAGPTRAARMTRPGSSARCARRGSTTCRSSSRCSRRSSRPTTRSCR